MNSERQSGLNSGKRLTKVDAENLETLILSEPENVNARISLVGYYWLHSQRFDPRRIESIMWLKHVEWLICYHPGHAILYWPEANWMIGLDRDIDNRLTELWEIAISGASSDPKVLRNAASFFAQRDTSRSLEIALQARQLDSQSLDLRRDCAGYLSLLSRRKMCGEETERLVRLNEELLSLDPGDLDVLQTIVYLSYQQENLAAARIYAQSILQIKNSDQFAHTIMGLLHLSEGSIEAAKGELDASVGEVTSIPSPFEFALADALLRRGQRDVVCRFLGRCRGSWYLGRPLLFAWALLEVRLGGKPRLRRWI